MPHLTPAWWPRSTTFTPRLPACRSGTNDAGSSSAARIVLFSDPDTLREEGVAAWSETRTTLRRLEEQDVAVVLWGNETRSQMEAIQRDLDLHHPFISETGAGLFVPHGYFRDPVTGGRVAPNYQVFDFGEPYDRVADGLHEMARKVGTDIIGFSDMSIEDVARQCAVSLSQARLAKLREYDEPFRMVDPEPAAYSRLCSRLRRVGLRCFTHETFHHATGVASKMQSLRLLATLYRQASDGSVLTVGLAKARSETCLLQEVDLPIVVEGTSADAARLGRKVPTARFMDGGEPAGWCEAILQLIHGHSDRRESRKSDRQQ